MLWANVPTKLISAPVQRIAALLVIAAFLLPLSAPKTALGASLECYCVKWLREAQGVQIKGDAWTITPTHNVIYATEGDVLLTTEGPGHAALIVGFEGEQDMGTYIAPQFIKVIEANYRKCEVGTRLIPWNSKEIRGIYRPLSTTDSL